MIMMMSFVSFFNGGRGVRGADEAMYFILLHPTVPVFWDLIVIKKTPHETGRRYVLSPNQNACVVL